jgi:hypothetical protein
MPEQTTRQLASLDREAVRAALGAAVGEEVVGAFARVDGDEGPWVAVAGSAEPREAPRIANLGENSPFFPRGRCNPCGK